MFSNTADCITHNPTSSGKIFKLQNICNDSGVIAAFNLDESSSSVSGTISPSDVDGLNGEEFAVYEHFSKELKILKADESLNIELKDIDDYKLYIIAPLKDGFAAIGRTDKFISPKTIKSIHGTDIKLIEDGEYAIVQDRKLIIKK